MRFERISPHPTFGIDDDAPVALNAHELVFERPTGVELEVNLAPHPGFGAYLTLATFKGASLVVEPTAANEIYVHMASWPRGHRLRVDKRSNRTKQSHLYRVDARGKKVAIEHRRVEVVLPSKLRIAFDFEPEPPWSEHVRVGTDDRPIEVLFGGANVMHVTVQAPKGRAKAKP